MSILYKSQTEQPFIPNVAFWTLDDSSWSDSSGNGYNLTDNNGVSTGTGIISGCAVFTPNSYLSLGSTNLNLTEDFSVSLWYKPIDISNYQTLFTSSGNFVIHHNTTNGIDINNTHVTSDISTSEGFISDTWYHIVAVCSNGITYLYVNGVFRSSTNQSFSIQGGIYLGGYVAYGQFYLNGSLDEVGIWDYALNFGQIKRLYNNGIGTQETSNSKINLNAQSYSINLHNKLEAFWNFDDNGSGGLNLNAANTNNTLTNLGGISLGDGKIGGGALFDVNGSLRGTVNTKLPITISGWFNINYWPNNFPYWSPLFVLQNSQHAGQTISDYQIAIGIWNNEYGTYLSTVACRCNCGIKSDYNSANPLINQWVHVAVTCDEQANVNLYVNGRKFSGNYAIDQLNGGACHPISEWANTTFDRLVIGDDIFSPNGWHSGVNTLKVDDVGVWGRILNDFEIGTLYNSGNGRQYPLLQELYSYTPPTSGLVAFYNFDGDANDSSGNGINLQGTYQQGGGKIGNGIQFTGDYQGVSYGQDVWDIYASPQSYSCSFWYKQKNSNLNNTIFGANFSAFGLFVQQQNNKIVAYIPKASYQNAATLISNYNLSLDKWVHVTITHDSISKTLSLYINGIFDSSTTYTDLTLPAQYQSFTGFAIGGSGHGDNIQPEYGGACEFDAVGLWNRVLSVNEIQSLYQYKLQYPFTQSTNKSKILSNYVAPSTPDQISGLYAWYDGNDNATILNNSSLPASNGEGVYTWLDKSGNGINLTNQGFNAPIYTTNVINGKPALRFTANGLNDGSQLRGTQNLGSGDVAYFVVYQWRDLHRTYFVDVLFALGHEAGSGGEGGIGTQTTNDNFSLHGNTFNGGTITLNKFNYAAVNYNSLTLQQTGYYNGISVGTQTGNSNVIDNDIVLGSWSYYYSLSFNGYEYFADADIAEVIIYNTSLSGSDMKKVNRYIKNKYNIH